MIVISSDEEEVGEEDHFEHVLEEVDTTKRPEEGISQEQLKRLENIRNAQK